jgi:hypothetical protein
MLATTKGHLRGLGFRATNQMSCNDWKLSTHLDLIRKCMMLTLWLTSVHCMFRSSSRDMAMPSYSNRSSLWRSPSILRLRQRCPQWTIKMTSAVPGGDDVSRTAGIPFAARKCADLLPLQMALEWFRTISLLLQLRGHRECRL